MRWPCEEMILISMICESDQAKRFAQRIRRLNRSTLQVFAKHTAYGPSAVCTRYRRSSGQYFGARTRLAKTSNTASSEVHERDDIMRECDLELIFFPSKVQGCYVSFGRPKPDAVQIAASGPTRPWSGHVRIATSCWKINTPRLSTLYGNTQDEPI